MTMLRITVSAEITSNVVVTWSPEYGATVLGDPEQVTVEEVAARETVQVPVRDLPMRQDIPRAKNPPPIEMDASPGECLICGCPGPHDPHGCPHDCLTYVEA